MKMCILNGSNMELVVFQIGIHDSLFYVSGKIVLSMPLYTTICYCGNHVHYFKALSSF
uniref:Uncharacterized protein n=1 Tax=Marmota marmota marmota TaxID=9994 RepID=A0A8C5YHH9_MARMA